MVCWMAIHSMEKNKAREGYGDCHGWQGFMVVNREWREEELRKRLINTVAHQTRLVSGPRLSVTKYLVTKW